MIKDLRFETWPEAYDYCREVNCPVVVIVGDERAKIFPSGACRPLFRSSSDVAMYLAKMTTTP